MKSNTQSPNLDTLGQFKQWLETKQSESISQETVEEISNKFNTIFRSLQCFVDLKLEVLEDMIQDEKFKDNSYLPQFLLSLKQRKELLEDIKTRYVD